MAAQHRRGNQPCQSRERILKGRGTWIPRVVKTLRPWENVRSDQCLAAVASTRPVSTKPCDRILKPVPKESFISGPSSSSPLMPTADLPFESLPLERRSTDRERRHVKETFSAGSLCLTPPLLTFPSVTLFVSPSDSRDYFRSASRHLSLHSVQALSHGALDIHAIVIVGNVSEETLVPSSPKDSDYKMSRLLISEHCVFLIPLARVSRNWLYRWDFTRDSMYYMHVYSEYTMGVQISIKCNSTHVMVVRVERN